MDTGYIILIDVVADQRGGLFVHPGTDLLIALLQIHRLLGDPRRIFSQDLSQHPGDLRNVRFGLLQFMRIQIYVFHTDRCGQHVHVPVVDIPTVCCDRCCAGLVPQRQVRIVIIIPNHQVVQPQSHR